MKVEDTTEDLNNVKTKLNLKTQKIELYEKEHMKIMEALNITNYHDILPAIQKLKESMEQNEEEYYTNAVDKLS